MKKFLNSIFGRITIVVVLLGVQIAFFIIEILKFSSYHIYIWAVLSILSILVVFYLVSKPINPTVKLAWIIPIMLFPLFGGLLYLCFGSIYIPKKLRKNMDEIERVTRSLLKQEAEVLKSLEKEDISIANQTQYIKQYSGFPVYQNTTCEYYKIGEDYYKALKQELEKAEHFIFMEYFIVSQGKMWDSILEILKRKVAQDVEVRFMYDDMGCLMLLPYGYDKQLEAMGIKCISFNPILPFMRVIMDNRDHRKITVIDGKVGFTGGINLADEYINEIERYGHWKDTGIKIEGDAVWNFTVMFLQMWNTVRFDDHDFKKYKVNFPKQKQKDGYVQPYGDTPLDHEILAENVYMNIINTAKKYVYIYTPYLIVDNEMITSLCLAAKRRVEVKIVTPGIPDKKMVYRLTQSYYKQLIEAGVKIYQYTPGFIHAKCFLSDDEVATVGTINMDYRSLYHHYECGIYLYHTKVTNQLKEDMLSVFELCEPITKEWCQQKGFLDSILKLLAPLM